MNCNEFCIITPLNTGGRGKNKAPHVGLGGSQFHSLLSVSKNRYSPTQGAE